MEVGDLARVRVRARARARVRIRDRVRVGPALSAPWAPGWG